MHWRYNWPQGIDDGTDDDKIIDWIKEPKKEDPPLRFIMKGDQWQ